MRKDERYNQRGVSASKEDVHNAIKNIDKGIFPKAFCKIIPDYLGGQKSYCNIMHADGAGTRGCMRQNSLKLRSLEDLTPESQRRLTFFAVSLAWRFLLKLPEERSF